MYFHIYSCVFPCIFIKCCLFIRGQNTIWVNTEMVLKLRIIQTNALYIPQ